jgi:hypothetical protein
LAPLLIDCIFCGDTNVPSSGEDVFPIWLQRKLHHYARSLHPDEPPLYVSYGYDDPRGFQTDIAERTPGGHATSKEVTGERATVRKLPEVCVTCNGGWMGRLEEAAKRLMPGLIEGKPKLLAPFDQLILATWVVKTCLTYDASREPRYISNEAGSSRFYSLGYPLPLAQVSIGHDPNHVMEGALVHARQQVMGSHPSLVTNLEAVRFAFQFDRLLFEAIINVAEDLPEDGIGISVPENPPYFERMWPPTRRPLIWPSDAARIVPPPTDATEEPMAEPE